MMERLPARLWIDALIRRASLAGASAFVLQHGDEERGDVLIKVARLDGTAAAYAPSMNLEGERIFLNLAVQGIGSDESAVDALELVHELADREVAAKARDGGELVECADLELLILATHHRDHDPGGDGEWQEDE